MKFRYYKTSDNYRKFREEPQYVEINTIEELKTFSNEYGIALIVDVYDKTIEIYDDYRE